MDDNLRHILRDIIVIIVSIFGITFIIKFFIAFINISLSLSNFVVGLFNIVLNILGIIVGVTGPILVILVLGSIGIYLFNQIIECIDRTKEIVSELINGRSERILPIFLAGVVQVLLLLLSKDYSTTSIKFLLSIYLWAFTTIILIIMSSGDSKGKTVGVVCLVLMSSSLATALVVRYRLYDRSQLKQSVQQIWHGIMSLSFQNLLSLLLIASFLLIMLFIAVYYGHGLKQKKPCR
ncbi:MAG: hypothetical protein GXO69_09490 [Acidobacteria bacterium]|nr:hypothetical protein [Acidobacteriota bacterium]